MSVNPLDWILRGARLPGRDGIHDLGLARGVITAIAAPIDDRAEHELDVQGRLVLPGFVNAHVFLPAEGDDLEGRAALLLERCLRHGTTALRLTVDLDGDEPLRPLRLLARVRAQYAARITVQLGLDVTPALDPRGPKLAVLLPHVKRAGADALHVNVGHAMATSPTLAEVIALADEGELALDLATDVAFPPGRLAIRDLALGRVLSAVSATRASGRTRLLHGNALAAVHRDDLAPLLRDVAALRIPLVVCPVGALRTSGRADPAHARRGVPRLREILDAGVEVVLGSGIVEPGTVALDPLALAWLAGYVAHMGVPPALERLRASVTTAAARSLGRDSPRLDGDAGGPADLVVLDAPTFAQAIVDHAEKLQVFTGGQLVHATERRTDRAPVAGVDQASRLLIRGATLLRRAGRHDVVIVDGTIREIGGDIAVSGIEEIAADGRLLVPAFVDAHLHVDKTFVMDRVDFPERNLTVAEAVAAMGRVKAGYSREDLLRRGRETLSRALRHGTTAVRAQCDVDPIIGLAALEALLALRREFAPLLDLQIVAFPQEGLVGDPKAVDLMRQALAAGADVVGGGPLDADWRAHIGQAFALAREFGAPVDIHADLAIDDLRPTARWESVLIASQTRAAGLGGRAAIGHFAASSAVDAAALRPVADALAEAGVSVAALTASEMYRQGMADPVGSRRGVPRVRDLLAAGVNVVFASNNVRDAFVTFGNADMLEQALLGSLGAYLGGEDDLSTALEMVTSRPASLMGLHHRNAVEVGKQADLVLLDARSAAEAIGDQVEKLVVIRQGRVVLRNSVASGSGTR